MNLEHSNISQKTQVVVVASETCLEKRGEDNVMAASNDAKFLISF
jgi:hypothetical protein